jgi:hypothetical protein
MVDAGRWSTPAAANGRQPLDGALDKIYQGLGGAGAGVMKAPGTWCQS